MRWVFASSALSSLILYKDLVGFSLLFGADRLCGSDVLHPMDDELIRVGAAGFARGARRPELVRLRNLLELLGDLREGLCVDLVLRAGGRLGLDCVELLGDLFEGTLHRVGGDGDGGVIGREDQRDVGLFTGLSCTRGLVVNDEHILKLRLLAIELEGICGVHERASGFYLGLVEEDDGALRVDGVAELDHSLFTIAGLDDHLDIFDFVGLLRPPLR